MNVWETVTNSVETVNFLGLFRNSIPYRVSLHRRRHALLLVRVIVVAAGCWEHESRRRYHVLHIEKAVNSNLSELDQVDSE